MGANLGDHSEGEPIATINVTPFVDIILVVLIIFMVTTPIIMKPSINVQLPKAASGDKSTPSMMNITITQDGYINLNGESVTVDNLKDFTSNLLIDDPGVQAIISADEQVAHGKVIQVIDVVKSAGVTKFAISVDNKK